MSVSRSVGRMLDRIAPAAARRMREIWYTLNGGRFDTLAGVIDQRLHAHRELLDRRLESVDQHLERLRTTRRADGGGVAFMLADSLARLDARSAGPERPIAVISVLPPLETGIANYSLRTFEASPVPVDMFSPFDRVGPYLTASRRLPAAGGPMQVFALEALAAALPLRNYAAVVWVLGNSDHHLPVIRLLREGRHLEPTAPTWVQLHDPVLFNLARLHADDIDSDAATFLEGRTRVAIPPSERAAVAKGDFSCLLDRPGLPVRALLSDVPLHGLIVHSSAARDILLRDWPGLGGLELRTLFLPVLDGFAGRATQPPHGFRVGSFGYPAASKRTELVVAAFRKLRARHPEVTLVLAGYNVAAYAKAEGLETEAGIELHDNPSTPRLLELMAGVDVAVQLRQQNTGESSGVVPQLLSRDIPTIASAVGAFSEYGDAVAPLPPEGTADDLCALMAAELSDPARRQAARRSYVAAHGPREFCAALLAECPADSARTLPARETQGA